MLAFRSDSVGLQIEDELPAGSGPNEATFALFSSFPERLDAIIESRGSAAVSGVSGDLSSHGGASLRQVCVATPAQLTTLAA